MAEQNQVNSVMSEKPGWWMLLRRDLILSWDKWPKCLSEKISQALWQMRNHAQGRILATFQPNHNHTECWTNIIRLCHH